MLKINGKVNLYKSVGSASVACRGRSTLCHKFKTTIWLAVLVTLAALTLAGCQPSPNQKPYEKSEAVMDTVATLQASGPNGQKAVEEGLQRLHELEALASNTVEDSDISRLNQAAGNGEMVKLSPEIFHMLEVSQEYSRLTGGAWDITLGALIDTWGIGTQRERIPSAEEIAKAKELSGWQHLQLNPADQSACLDKAGVKIDAGGIAKGMALDELRKIYEKHGIKDGLINLGSSTLYALGKNNQGKDWRVGIRHPRNEEQGVLLAIVPLSNQALSTSGDYERYFLADGQRYHHILSNETGQPARSGIMSDTIIVDGSIPDAGLLSDLLTTAVFVMGQEKGRAFLNSLPEGISGELNTEDGLIYTVHGMEGRMEKINSDFSLR